MSGSQKSGRSMQLRATIATPRCAGQGSLNEARVPQSFGRPKYFLFVAGHEFKSRIYTEHRYLRLKRPARGNICSEFFRSLPNSSEEVAIFPTEILDEKGK